MENFIHYFLWWPTEIFNFFAGNPDTIIGWVIYILLQYGWFLYLIMVVMGFFIRITEND